MKKALLVGSSFSAMPLLKELKNRSLNVSVCGSYRDDPCHKYSNNSYYIDYSIKGDLLDLVKEENFDYLIPSCNDTAYNSCSWVQSKLKRFFGFDDDKITQKLHNKSKFRDYLRNKDLPSPAYTKSAEEYIEKKHPFPCIAKPVDSFSGKGIEFVKHSNQLNKAMKKAISFSAKKDCVIEEFLEGSLHSHSAFIKNNEICFDYFVDEFCTVYPYQVDCSNHPSILLENIKNKIRKSITFIIKDLNLEDGLLHTQIIVNNNNFWIIETMRRAPGDLYGSLILSSSSDNYWDNYIKAFLNEKVCSNNLSNLYKPIARHTISTKEELSTLSFSLKLDMESLNVVQLKNSGNILKKAPIDKMSILFIEFKDIKTLKEKTSMLSDLITINSYGLREYDKAI